jgi:DNA primase large subunit
MQLTRDDLLSLEQYSAERNAMRQQVMAHKKNRRLAIGEHLSLYFEDKLTMQYQIQEVLRAERIFEAAEINQELEAYNPLIPDGSNWKVTLMVEYKDPLERASALSKLIGIERQTWLQVDGFDKVYAIANEDLERETEEKTSAVHFLRYELSPEMIAAAKQGTAINAGVEHENYSHSLLSIPANIRDSIVQDFE